MASVWRQRPAFLVCRCSDNSLSKASWAMSSGVASSPGHRAQVISPRAARRMRRRRNGSWYGSTLRSRRLASDMTATMIQHRKSVKRTSQ